MQIIKGPTNGWNPVLASDGRVLVGAGSSRLVSPDGAVQELGDGYPAGFINGLAYRWLNTYVNPDGGDLIAPDGTRTHYNATTVFVDDAGILEWLQQPTRDRDLYRFNGIEIPLDRPARGCVYGDGLLVVDDPSDGYKSRVINAMAGIVIAVLREKAADAIIKVLPSFGRIVFYNGTAGPTVSNGSSYWVVSNIGVSEGRGDVLEIDGRLFVLTCAFGSTLYDYQVVARFIDETAGIIVGIPGIDAAMNYDASTRMLQLIGMNSGAALEGWANGQLAIANQVNIDSPRQRLSPAAPPQPVLIIPPVPAHFVSGVAGFVSEQNSDGTLKPNSVPMPYPAQVSWGTFIGNPHTLPIAETFGRGYPFDGRPLAFGLLSTEDPATGAAWDAFVQTQITGIKTAHAGAVYIHEDNTATQRDKSVQADLLFAEAHIERFIGQHIVGAWDGTMGAGYRGLSLNVRSINWPSEQALINAVGQAFALFAQGRCEILFVTNWRTCESQATRDYILACFAKLPTVITWPGGKPNTPTPPPADYNPKPDLLKIQAELAAVIAKL